MKILICHERFIARFGVDRVLLALARDFLGRGHAVTLAGMDLDPWPLGDRPAPRVIRVPRPDTTIEADVETTAWLADHWEEHFGGENGPDVVLTAGWPFLSAIPLFESRGCRVVYQDHGVIPTDGLPEIGWRSLSLLEELRRVFLPAASAVVAVSRFVRDTQTAALIRLDQPLEVIPNGVDHIAAGASSERPSAVRVLSAGRFEPGTYKQSELVFALEQILRDSGPTASIGVLAQAGELAASIARNSGVVALGRPSDAELAGLVRGCEVVVCFSRWEGFNLPLAEAQVLGKPCLVFDIGAHREVVAHPWLLCADLAEMAGKVRALLDGTAPAEICDGTVFRAWGATRKRTWAAIAARYLELFGTLVRRERAASPARARRMAVLMDVTNATRDPSNSGCVRVTRRLAAEWQAYLDVVFVVWEREAQAFRFPTPAEFRQLGAFQGPAQPVGHPESTEGAPVLLEPWLGCGAFDERVARPGWILLPEIRHRPDLWPILECAARLRLRTASIFHDAIPLVRPDLVPDPAYREGHADYMRGLSRVDVSVANSRASAAALRAFWEAERLSGRAAACLLPGGLPGERPGTAAVVAADAAPFILMVSTLEPRKGYRRLIEAFVAARARAQQPVWRLVLVGGRLWWSSEIARFVEEACRAHPEITWVENATDEQLRQFYRDCAFTVYASEIEGFGLPIMESVWHGRPCLCHDDGVMRELAAGGGCVTADLLQPDTFQAALLRLMDDRALRERLAAECRARSVKRWSDFAAEFWARLACTRWAVLEPFGGDATDEGMPAASAVAGRLSFVIPTYNRLDLLQVCLRTLRETLPGGLDAEIIVVDDASGDGTRAWLERGEGAAAGLRIVRHATNRGYGAAVNHAVRIATGTWLVLLNHDLAFRVGWLEPMLAAARRRERFFAVGNIQCAAHDGRLDHAGIVFDAAGHPDHFEADLAWLQRVPEREFPAVTFACALVDRARFLALGGFDSQFLNGFEDVDLCLRARFQGWPSLVANHSVVDHQISATPGRKLAEPENRHRFFARWRTMAVVLGRDWMERLAWERVGGVGVAEDARPAGPCRVLIDLTSAPADEAPGIVARLVEAFASPPAGGQPERLIVVTGPEAYQALEATSESSGVARGRAELWCLVDRDGAPLAPGTGPRRIVSGPAVTAARRLQADVVVTYDGDSSLVTPDIPTLAWPLGVSTAQAAGVAVTGYRVCEPDGASGSPAIAVRAAVEAFRRGGVSWCWSEAWRRLDGDESIAPGGATPLPTGVETADQILCCIDEPVLWEERVPLVEIRGWCVHRESRPITQVFVRADSGHVWRGVMGCARPDVAAAFPAIATAGASGFSVRVRACAGSFELWAGGVDSVVRLRRWNAADAAPA
ncbi:MAG: glycosyltransferase [Opitutaceae bacterium]|nr:glycosyltransferase [Opitutaceae bacterium]